MAREYNIESGLESLERRQASIAGLFKGWILALFVFLCTPLAKDFSFLGYLLAAGVLPAFLLYLLLVWGGKRKWVEKERKIESEKRGGKEVVGQPPDRFAFQDQLEKCREKGDKSIDGYLCGFELDNGDPIWVSDDDLCQHAAVFAKTGVGKTLWLEGLMFQQMARARASGLTFIDAKRDPGTLADIILMCLITGRMEDLIVVDPFDPAYTYNFVFTTQRPDVKARKVLRCGLPPTSDQSTTKHYDRLAADAVYRVVRAMESLGLAWSVRDIAVALSAFIDAYPRLRDLLAEDGDKNALIELGHLAGTYKTAKGSLDSARLTDNLRGIASELHSISNSEAGEMFCVPRADLSLTDAILRGKIIYYMLPRLEEAESAARMVKVFREDLEVSIGEVTSSRIHHLEDPHMVIIDEGASTFGPTWANLFELARKGRFALLFGAQSVGGLMDETMGLSEQFYERVIANVNLKVIMRIGDNKTAMDMSEWIGKVSTHKKSFATGFTTGISSHEYTKSIEINRKSSDNFRDAVTVSEDETDLVSPEELKHEMGAEKGLAWFDKGDGILRKGRACWFNADLPSTWEGRENLVKWETVEADEIGLAEWVDEQILIREREASENPSAPKASAPNSSKPKGPPPSNIQDFSNKTKPIGPGTLGSSANTASSQEASSTEVQEETVAKEAEAPSGPFKINPAKGFRGQGRSRTTIMSKPAPTAGDGGSSKNTEAASAKNSSSPKQENGAKNTAAKPSPAKPKAETSQSGEGDFLSIIGGASDRGQQD